MPYGDSLLECNWKKHPKHKDILVSDNGRVLSYKKGTWNELYPSKTNYGYCRITIGHSEHSSMHRLVAETFIPNIDNKTQVNHIDGNKENNCVDNLEWCTQNENIQHGIRTGLIPPKQKGNAIQIIETGECFISETECAKKINGVTSGISNCLHGLQKSYKGYHFKKI